MENSKCNHMKDGEYTIKYDSLYEMRSSQMYCTQCNKSGSWDELVEESKTVTENKEGQ